MAYTQGRLASAWSAVALSSSNTDMAFPRLFSPVRSHRSPFFGEPHAGTDRCASGDRRLLVYVPQPVVLVKGTGCSFAQPGPSAPLGSHSQVPILLQ